MNIVKGVAGFIRRTSSGHHGGSAYREDRFNLPRHRVYFSEVGAESVLHSLWQRYENTHDKAEKRQVFYAFLKQFLEIFRGWEPDTEEDADSTSATSSPLEHPSQWEDTIGCCFGHPTEVLLALIEDVTYITSLVTEMDMSPAPSTSDRESSLTITSEGLPLLEALMIVVRSTYNCEVLGYYGMVQKLIALIKAAVVQLKTVAGVLSVDDGLSKIVLEKYRLLQKLLVHVLSTICSFIELKSDAYEVAQLFNHTTLSVPRDGSSVFRSFGSFNVSVCGMSLRWKEKAVTTVMEAGGLNWLVELLRVIRRLNIEEQRQNMPLHYLIMRALHSAIFENSRAQNHFRSIGGLEVLLDGIVLPSDCDFLKQSTMFSLGNGKEFFFLGILQLHALSLEVLREAIFGNLNNLQFLCESGRVHKFANSFCSPAFILQECKYHDEKLVRQDEGQIPKVTSKYHDNKQRWSIEASNNPLKDSCILEFWKNYAVALSSGLCSFIPAPEDSHSTGVEGLAGRNIPPVSAAYIELSIKWILKVLLVVFPCIKACSNEDGLPTHLRLFVFTLQRNVLHVFREALISSPSLLDVFRGEGIWELLFSENFFYFGPALEEHSGVSCTQCENSVASLYLTSPSASICSNNVPEAGEVTSPQTEVISFVEFAAMSSGSRHNTPECSALLDALEQSSSKPEVSIILAKSMNKLLKHSPEKTVASFNKLDGVSRVLKVACIQAQRCGSSGNANDVAESYRVDPFHSETSQRFNTSVASHRWCKCIESSVELFTTYLSRADDAKSLVLKSTSCIDCLFDLFWVEDLRNLMLGYILDLMKTTSNSEEDRKGKLHLCSKYFETFNQVKEKEKEYTNISIDLLAGMREMLAIDQLRYQALFHDGECFLHVVSLLNGVLPTLSGEKLVLSVLQTLTSLLANNCALKAAFRSLVGKGYQTLQNLLLDYCRGQPTEQLINALLDMLVDGKFDIRGNPLIQNEDAIILYLSVLQKSSDSLRQQGLNVFLQLLRDSISNRDSCVRAGMLNFLLDWFSQEESDSVILKISLLIQATGGHSISGKDIRKIFALLRSEKVGNRQQYCSLLMNSILSMLNEKGPTAFFDFIGNDSGIIIRTPMHWPISKGFTFSCWLRLENFPQVGGMGLFSFLSEHGKGCFALLTKDKLVYESIHQKRQGISLNVNIVTKKWHFLCITHSIGRTFSGGSILRCYVNGALVSSERCRYPRIYELLTSCSIGCKIHLPHGEEENSSHSIKEASSFLGQIGPIYMFNDAITPEQVLGINSLGPSYMYSFLDNEDVHEPLPGGVFDAKDGLSSKMIFGLNAQASKERTLYNVAPLLESALDKSSIEATVMTGTQLCSRRLLQQIIYVVGGVSVFFPLFTQSQWYDHEEPRDGHSSLQPISKERLTAEVIELIASVLDENFANQQQMHLVSGFSILGFLLQSVPPQQLNLETLSALKHLFNVVANSGLSEFLVKDAISCIFLNPLVWVHTGFKTQRELCMFLSQQFDNDPRLLSLCRLPHIIDLIHQYYWDNAKCRYFSGGKRSLHSVSETIMGERPSREEIRKIRLLLLSLGEMSLRQSISSEDVKALVAFFETSQDMACVEDLLHMIVRAISQKAHLVSFVEQVNSIGGCQVFINLLQREYEPIRLLSLQFLGRILIGLPSEKKGLKFFTLAVGRSKSISESTRTTSFRIHQLLFSAISDRLFRFPVTEDLCAALFDALLGGASPKQVLRKQSQFEKQRSKTSGSQFVLPQILPLIFKILSECENVEHRTKITADLRDLLDSNPSNIESLMEHGWNAWLTASMELTVVKSYKMESLVCCHNEITEQRNVRNLYSTVLGHYILTVKGGWQSLEETANFILMNFEQGCVSYHYFLRDLYEDLIWRIWKISSEENILALQPCRDNTLYLLKLIDELLLSEIDHKLPFPARSSELPPEFLDTQSYRDISFALSEALLGGNDEQLLSNAPTLNQPVTSEDVIMDEDWWTLYDLLWIIISDMNGKGQHKMLLKSASSPGPTLGQRARGLVESLNIPAAEMAAVVVSGGITNALGGKSSKNIDKAMLLRGEKCPRIVFRLLVLYLCRASLSRASRCVQQIIPLLPCLLVGDDENSKNRLQLFIWSLLAVRSEYGMLDGGTRFHVMSHLIRETVSCGKSMLATSLAGRDDSSETGSSTKDTGALQNLIQKDRILAAVSDESNYIKTLKADRSKQLQEWRTKINESFSAESSQKRNFEDEVQSSLSLILASDDNRRSAFQLAHDEERQTVAEKWIHVFRSLIDERGPWSANPFPNCDVRRWKLDKTEDSWRRRPKLRQNYRFDEKLCQPPASASCKDVVVPSGEIKLGSGLPIPEQMKQFLLKGIRRITDEVSSELSESDNESSSQKVLNSEEISDHQSELVKDVPFSKDPVQERKESSSTEVEGGEVLMSVPCVLITPKRKLFGQLAVMRSALHFFGEFLVEGTAGFSVFKNFDCTSNSESGKQEHLAGIQKQKFLKLPVHLTSYSEKQNSLDSVDKQPKNVKRHRRWNLSKVKAVHWNRYLLRYTAIEVFFSNSVAPVFFNFASQQLAKDVGTLVVNARNELLLPKGSNRDRTGSISLVDRRIAQELAESARESWRRREMTNFEYLMILNTLAGRSYNDLTQYPVFPWVLADYSSETLDFNKSSTFRDLSKPVGALDSKRFEVFEDRYRSFDDPDIPSFYYGSHYSSGGIVLYYLIRLEPLATLHRNLQGGKFDHADRLFQSIEGTYRNCLSNTSDVKELIPEFFYMPEFLVNSNFYHLGVRQDGEPIGDVCLPPWAKGSPEEFISKNREALESEYVSSNLHNWIDLVFGYKQRGKPAVEAANIFYYLTYEGAVDLENMEDELQRSAIEDQIANFGQTPIQIFRKKHPRRGPPIPIAHPLRFAPGSINLTSVVSSKYPASPLLYVNVFDSIVVLVSRGLTMSVKMWLTTQLQSGGNFTFSGSQDPLFGIGSDILSYRKIGSPLAEGFEIGAQCFSTLQTPSENFLISCGNWENSFQVISLFDGRVVQSIRAHKDVVSAVAVTSDGSILATGSYDTTVMVWEVQHSRGHEKRARNVQSELPRKDYVISETPFHILCGHDDVITCLYVSVELDVVISGSKDGTCVFHTLREGKYVRSIRHPCGSPLSNLVVSRHGWLVMYSDDDLSLHLYSINGKHIATTESNGRLNCVELSVCGEFLACAGDQGQIIVRSVRSLELVRKYSGSGKVITSLVVTPEECFLAGTKEGILLVYSIENPQVRKATLSRTTKSRPLIG